METLGKEVKLVIFCVLCLFVVSACSMWPEPAQQAAPAGPVIVNNMPAPAPTSDSSTPWLIVLALAGVATAVWMFRDRREARARAETAERVLERHLLLTGGAVTVNGRYQQPALTAWQPTASPHAPTAIEAGG